MLLNQTGVKARLFVGIGEVVFDAFENGTETLGGAPLNVAFHAHQLAAPLGLGRGIVASCVGEDLRGERIRRALRERGLATAWIATDSRRPTGRVSVFMRNGEPGYQIEADAAWDHLEPGEPLDRLAARCDAVCFGSLAQRSPVSRTTIRAFLEKAASAVRLYDVNLRCNTVSTEKGYSTEIIDTSCQLATIIKGNCSELLTICGLLGMTLPENSTELALRNGMEMLLARYPVQAVVLTSGARGTTILTRDQEVTLRAPRVPEAEQHPVGAGDACAAGILFVLVMGRDYATATDLGNRMGAWVASQQSATPPIPDSILDFARELTGVASQV